MPTVKSLLREARARLEHADVEDARLDARLLLQHASGLAHDNIIADPEFEIDAAMSKHFLALVDRRCADEPVSRILGEREFYGRPFKISSAVLDPRPDTETLIEACLTLPKPQRILDLGTGSGILAVTLLAEFQDAEGVAVDVSQDALSVAQQNARALGVGQRLTFIQGSWFQNVDGVFDLIVSNPPYIPAGDIAGLQAEVRNHDPHLALDGGTDGLMPYREIAEKAALFLKPQAKVVVEIGAGQSEAIGAIFVQHGLACSGSWRDLGGHVRVLAFSGR